MQESPVRIYVVDDDEALRDSLVWLLGGASFKVRAFASAESFLSSYNPREAAVLVLDVRMPGMSGLQLRDLLATQHASLPIIFMTGHGDVPMAVEAVKKGAFDFIEKPFNDDAFVALIERAAARARETNAEKTKDDEVTRRLVTLSPREREVMDLVVQGKLNKTIADVLSISIKTVEAHRARVMEKMSAKSLADLVKMTIDKAT